MYRHRRLFSSFSGTLAAVILALLLISMLLLASYWFFGERSKVEKEFLDKQDMTREMLRQSIVLIDRGILLYELVFDPDMKQAMELYQQEYEKAQGNIEQLNLSEVKNQISGRMGDTWDVYLIHNGVVIDTTFPDDRNLDFTKYPDLFQKYEYYRMNGTIVIDRTVKGFAPGAPSRKFAYQGTPDRKYLLEISKNFDKFHPETSKASYHELLNTTTSLNPTIVSIDLYNTQIKEIARKSSVYGSDYLDQDAKKLVKKVFSSKNGITIEDEKRNRITEYSFLPVEESGAPSTPMMHLVAAIQYSTEMRNTLIFQLTILYISFIVITTLIAFMVATAISRHLTKPLTQIGEDVDKIASGDLDHQITSTGAVETEKIEQSISRMVLTLKENIESLRAREKELSKELLMRRKAEELYYRLFDSSYEAVFILEKGVIRDCNQEACLLLGRNRDQIMSRKLADFSPKPEEFITNISAGTQTYSAQWDFIRPDGSVIETQVHLNAITIDDTSIMQVIVRDMTELNELYRREMQAITQIEENLGQLAAINDQIRNPLAVISSLCDMNGNEYGKEIQDQIARINNLVNEIDRGFVDTEKVRQYLHKHYGLGDDQPFQ